jgi:hypothetical protein
LRRWAEVLTAVELDGQMPVGAVEVEDIGATGMLAPKLEASESFGSEVSPQSSLCVCAVSAQSATTCERDVHATVFGSISSPLLTPGIDKLAGPANNLVAIGRFRAALPSP